MGSRSADAADWEDGCANDEIRNRFIVPQLSRLIDRRRPSRILDLGAATGYIARSVDRNLTYRPHWIIVDCDNGRLALAHELCREGIVCTIIASDLKKLDAEKVLAPVDLIVLSFTLLEFEDKESVISLLPSLTVVGGFVFIVMPDPWEEVLQAHEPSLEYARALISGSLSLAKTDRFTGSVYPFYVARLETLISLMIVQGFALVDLDRGGDRGQVFALTFQRLNGGDRD